MVARRFLLAVSTLSALVLLAASGAGAERAARGGSLDPGFGEDGLVWDEGFRSCLPGEGGCPNSVGLATQRGQGLVAAAGTLEAGCRSRFALARFRQGVRDPGFGRGGLVFTRFGSNSAVATAAVVLQDGRIVVVGELLNRESGCVLGPPDPRAHLHLGGSLGFALARYSPDGRLDTTFGHDGRVVTAFEGADGVADVLLQEDAKVVVVGSSADPLALARYDAQGRLDPSFGDKGTARIFLDSHFGTTGKAALDGAGRILVPFAQSVIRLTREGRLDTSFGRDGYASLEPGQARFSAVAMARGMIVAAGGGSTVARFSSDGVLDRRFGSGGVSRVPFRGGWVNDVAVQKDGKIVVLGTGSDFVLGRLTGDGSLDRHFGEGGTATADFGYGDAGEVLVIQADGKLVAAGVISRRPGAAPRADAIGIARFVP